MNQEDYTLAIFFQDFETLLWTTALTIILSKGKNEIVQKEVCKNVNYHKNSITGIFIVCLQKF